mmetsp:Transcript_33124/g.76330  ORF Transcript_33124/g.76330 Transcript_33124/m.76330 type:complete len:83 (-) Transcript_33124:44-292(-)
MPPGRSQSVSFSLLEDTETVQTNLDLCRESSAVDLQSMTSSSRLQSREPVTNHEAEKVLLENGAFAGGLRPGVFLFEEARGP